MKEEVDGGTHSLTHNSRHDLTKLYRPSKGDTKSQHAFIIMFTMLMLIQSDGIFPGLLHRGWFALFRVSTNHFVSRLWTSIATLLIIDCLTKTQLMNSVSDVPFPYHVWQVSWIRRRDWHIMSSGSHIYTADNRFSVLNRPGSPDWILMLKSPHLYDSGTYECQVNYY